MLQKQNTSFLGVVHHVSHVLVLSNTKNKSNKIYRQPFLNNRPVLFSFSLDKKNNLNNKQLFITFIIF